MTSLLDRSITSTVYGIGADWQLGVQYSNAATKFLSNSKINSYIINNLSLDLANAHAKLKIIFIAVLIKVAN